MDLVETEPCEDVRGVPILEGSVVVEERVDEVVKRRGVARILGSMAS